jgi:16S rRNA (adenine1518-N6/adenine1519-N6)-dimethyltransferase
LGRRFGQHFLARHSVLERIAAAAAPEQVDTIIEIGPGRGALTAHLLPRARHVVAVEIDPVLVEYLRAKFREEPRIEILEADILKVDLTRWGRHAVAGNVPYYITSPIVERILQLRVLVSRAVLLVQKEVAERLTAAPGSRDYGFLSVAAQLYAEVELLFSVSASAFRPPPKVESAVVRLTPRQSLAVANPSGFLEFTGLCFQQKRKTLRNNLAVNFERAFLDTLPDLGKRAEQLSIPELVQLYERIPQTGARLAHK